MESFLGNQPRNARKVLPRGFGARTMDKVRSQPPPQTPREQRNHDSNEDPAPHPRDERSISRTAASIGDTVGASTI